jgi:hypothetical protein
VWLGIPVLWTWAAAGSPLGALTAHLFHASSFDAESLSAYEGTRELFANNFQWRFEAAYWNLPLIVLAILGVGFEKARDRRFRWWLMTGCQFLVIIALLPKEIRHLGGIQYPLMASGMVWLVTAARERGFTQRAVALFAGAGCLPWLAFALWISSIYVPLATGQLTPAEFLRKYSGLQVDYEMLDKALPRDASILVGRSRSDVTQYAWYSRPPVYYAPRPVLFSAGEAEGKSHVYLMYLGQGAEGKHGAIPFDPYLPPGEALGRNVYSNAQSRFYPSRTPGGTPGLARLDVFELLPRRDVAATVP